MIEIIKELSELLPPAKKRRAIALQFLLVVTAVTQVAGVTSLAPFIALLTNPSIITQNPITGAVYRYFGFQSELSFLVAFAGAVIVFIIVASLLSALTSWMSVVFAQDLGVHLQGALYDNYLSKDHTYFSRNNTSTMTAMISQEAPRLVYMVVQPLLTLLGQLFIVLTIGIGLLIIDPRVALSALAIVGGLYYWIFKVVKKNLGDLDELVGQTNSRRHKILNESLGGIREVRLLALEKKYSSQLEGANASNAKAMATASLVADLPRYLIESIAFSALLALAIYLISRNDSPTSLVSYLSLYAMAGYKLLPSAQTVFRCASQIKANRSALDSVHRELCGNSASKPMHTQPTSEVSRLQTALELDNVSYSYPGTASLTLQQVTLKLVPGRIYAIAGVSGSGKSTLADITLGLLQPTHGTVRVNGQVLSSENVRSWQRQLGYVPQSVFLVDDTIAANIAFGVDSALLDADRIERVAALANIDGFINTLPGRFEFVVGERGAKLSGGQRQRVAIARALYHDAAVLVLDEATSALDNQTESEVVSTLRQLREGKIVIMIAHRITSLRSADQVIVLKNGKVEGIGAFDDLAVTNPVFSELISSTEFTRDSEESSALDGPRAEAPVDILPAVGYRDSRDS